MWKKLLALASIFLLLFVLPFGCDRGAKRRDEPLTEEELNAAYEKGYRTEEELKAAYEKGYRTEEDLEGAEFECDSVIVTLTREETIKFKNYSETDFREIGCASVEDFSEKVGEYVRKKQNGEDPEEPVLTENFKRMLRLELKEKTRESVVRALRILSVREEVLFVGPNYIYHLVD